MREHGAASTTPGRVGDVRRQNLALVLGNIGPDTRATRADIAAATGLTKASVSSLVAELLETGLVEELGVTRDGERGRPGVGLALDARRGALGAEINVDYLAVGVVDLHGTLRFHEVADAENRGRDAEDVLGELSALARRCVEAAQTAGVTLLGGGLAVPGLVNPARGTVLTAPNLGWRDADLSTALGGLIPDAPFGVVLSNEANSAALAELWYGHGASLRDYLFISGEVGVGGGLVIGSELFAGPQGYAGEVGHVVVEPGGRRCSCGGRGCLETVAGQEAILAAAGITDGGSTTAARMSALQAALGAGDAQAMSAVERAGHYLGIAVVSAGRLVDLSAVVLGGHFAALGTWIRPALLSSLDGFAPGLVPADRVAFSELGTTAALRGAAGGALLRALAAPYELLP
ncbi:ROK family transcriptional regulator [Sinomonas sp. ASV322]|uniref:ROK family transcriptional regulator n=1 Tax=Sinomonas sp. ASV322 TaxID=3041920 RepID=UPI0027DB01A6|nr:ROK family transcriptional regulator [Sinomonas sp. ASV322]MDQ4502900.1 ROK family transcriptional regulator [Sinomonas sp. ASV322]